VSPTFLDNCFKGVWFLFLFFHLPFLKTPPLYRSQSVYGACFPFLFTFPPFHHESQCSPPPFPSYLYSPRFLSLSLSPFFFFLIVSAKPCFLYGSPFGLDNACLAFFCVFLILFFAPLLGSRFTVRELFPSSS